MDRYSPPMANTLLKENVLVMNERKVEVYFRVAFETHKFTVNLEADISHVMSIDSLLFNLM